MTEFFKTAMGRTFYEGTMPRLVRVLEALNANVEKLIELQTNPLVVVKDNTASTPEVRKNRTNSCPDCGRMGFRSFNDKGQWDGHTLYCLVCEVDF